MKRALWGTLALLACGDDDGGQGPGLDASVRDGSIDAAREGGLDAALITQCGPVAACRNGMLTSLPALCTGTSNGTASGALWKVCVVDPLGNAAFIEIRADQTIVSPGWTHSNYAAMDNTLSDQGTDACVAEREKLTLASEENLPDAGSLLCYRPNSI